MKKLFTESINVEQKNQLVKNMGPDSQKILGKSYVYHKLKFIFSLPKL